jgi:type IV secretory pathway TraG/TraD family ATPase VirD4
MPLSDRVGHMVVIARTRHGKTRLAEVLTTQDIRRGNNCVIVLDPKGDADYLKRIYVESQKAGRQLIIFHLGYPELSARYNAIGSFSRITEGRDANRQPVAG